MSKSSMTVRDVFELPEPGGEKPSDWKTFENRVSKEVKGIKTAALPDLAEKVGELFEIPIPDIFVSSWKKADGIKALLEESRKSPETVMNTELGEHTINTQHRPSIEVRIQNKAVKKLEFTLKLVFNLKGFVLKIQDGLIRGMQTGLCDVKGKLEYQGLVIAEKKLTPITLPGSLSFQPVKVAEEKPAEQKPADSVTSVPLDFSQAAAALTRSAAANEKVDETKAVAGDAASDLLPTATEKTGPSEIEPAVAEPVISPPTVRTSASAEPAKIEPAPSVDQLDVLDLPAAPVFTPTTRGGLSTPEPSEGIKGAPPIAISEPVETKDDSQVAAYPQVSSAAGADEERLVWEVDDPDDVASPQQASDNANGADAESQPETSENPQDAIDRMSRELADRRVN